MQPKIILSAGNISHYHHTAFALQQAGYLWKYFCVFSGQNDLGIIQKILPADIRKRLMGKSLPGLDVHKMHTVSIPYLLTQGLRRFGMMDKARMDALFGNLYDRATQYRADDGDILHFVNGMGLKTAQQVKVKGQIVICDIRAEHVDHQEKILQTEYDQIGLPYHSLRAHYRDRLVAEYALADFLIVPSAYVADTMICSGLTPEKIFIVPYGVALSRFSTWGSQREEERVNRPFRILYVGQVIPRKGIHYLIQAFEKLNLQDSELVIVGRGDTAYQALLNEMTSHGNRRIRFIGHLPQMELGEYYRNSDIFVLPTLSEGSALVIYEAMSAGLPVITTPNAGSVVRDGKDGFIVPTRDAEALREKLFFLYRYRQMRREMGHAAMIRSKEFTWERYGERLLEIYDIILSNRGSKCSF